MNTHTVAHKGVSYAVTLGEGNKIITIRRAGCRRTTTLHVVQPVLDHMLGSPLTPDEALAAIDWANVAEELAPRRAGGAR